jgi:hypothetical protein
MAQTGYTPISLYYSSTASATPTANNLVAGELAINTADGKLFYKDSAGVVQVIGTKGGVGSSTTTQVLYNSSGLVVGSANLTFNGTTLTANTIGAFTLGGTIAGGGNQINNVIIGASTPLAGSFTTLSASGVATFSAGTVSLPAITTTGDTNTGIYFPAADTIAFTEGGAESMRIDSSGNVGIGTSSPAYKLDVAAVSGIGVSSAQPKITFNDTGTSSHTASVFLGGASLVHTVDPFSVVANSNQTFVVDGAERMRIDSGGNVGIGTTTPNKSTSSKAVTVNNASGYVAYEIAVADAEVWRIASNGSAGVFDVTAGTQPRLFWTNGSERMRIDSSGNVGIGTSSPGVQFEVYNASTARIRVNSATSTSDFAQAGTSLFVSNNANGPMILQTNNTERMRIDDSGNLLVGTTSAVAVQNNNSLVVRALGDTTQNHANGTASGSGYLIFGYNAGTIGSITQSGTTAVLYNLTSDARLKTNIVDAPSGNIDDVKVRSFDWKSDGSHIEYGFIAQELVEVAPYAVHQPSNPEEMMAVDYSKLVPMMIKEIQDLKQRIKTLESK